MLGIERKPGIQSRKFLNISKISHRFPENLKGLNIPITLLHNHYHCPTNNVLIYTKDFTESFYQTKEKA